MRPTSARDAYYHPFFGALVAIQSIREMISPFFDLNAEIRASLVSERVGPLGFDVSINNNYTSYRILNQSFTVKGGI